MKIACEAEFFSAIGSFIPVRNRIYRDTRAVDARPPAHDARPSDAVALAIRTKAPIYADASVLDETRAWDEETT